MNNQYKKNQQLNHIVLWHKRKLFVLLVLLFSIVMLACSFYYVLQSDFVNSWVYPVAGTAICLIVGVFFPLLKEVRIGKKLVEDLKMQNAYGGIITGSINANFANTRNDEGIDYIHAVAKRLTGWSKSHAKHIINETEKQYQTLIQNLPEALYSCDEKGYIKLYNAAAVELWGKEPAAGKDRWCGAVKIFNTDGTSLQPDSSPMAIAIRQGKSVQGTEIIIQRSNGKLRHVISYPTPIFNADGTLGGAVDMLIDVTDKREKEIMIKHSEEKYHSLIEQASDAIFINDYEGNILEANDSAAKLLGFSKKDFLSMNIKELYSEAELLARPIMYKELFAGEQTRIERNMQHRDGSQIPVEISVKMLSDGRVMAIARDISENKKAQQVLKESELFNRSILSSINSHIAVAEENGLIISVNKAWENFSKETTCAGLERTGPETNFLEACKRSADAGDTLAAKALHGFQQLMNREIPSFEMEYACTSQNLEQWFQLKITPFGGDSTKAVINHTDISSIKKVEKDTAAYIKSLEEMLYMVSHKLRQPITQIAGLSAIIKDENNSVEEIQEMAVYISQSIKLLDTFSRDLSAFIHSALEQKKLLHYG
jgi:PAS domain S-box-containing protein